MEAKDLNYLLEGVMSTVREVGGDIYKELVAKGKRRMGQESEGSEEAIVDLIRKTRESEPIAELIAKGKKGQEELVAAVGKEIKQVLSAAGVVTKSEFAHLQKRVDHIEKKAEKLAK